MKKIKSLMVLFLAVAFSFTSCTKDDLVSNEEQQIEKGTLSFGATLTDLVNKSLDQKQMMDMPACSDAAPASVEFILSLDGENVVGEVGDPATVSIYPVPYDYDNDGEDEYFTDESVDLELMPGDYMLEWFRVLDDMGNVIWVAPIDTGVPGDFSNLVGSPLPMPISVQPGVKKYVPVDVICYDDREVNRYGYLFFDLEATQAIEFCLFGNVCDETGRHYPANFRFDVWTYSGDPANPKGTPLFDENDPFINVIGVNNDGDAYAEPLCVFLPDSPVEDVYYGELYLIENGNSTLIRNQQFTDADVKQMFDGTDATDYYHFREGCDMQDTPGFLDTTDDEVPTIDRDTEIYIYFDSSGSMDGTLSPLNIMRSTILKETLLPLYDGDETAYDEKVVVISRGSERTFDFLNIEGDTPEGNVIVLVFQDEAETVYHSGYTGWDENTTRTSTYDTDISTLRGRLSSFPNNYYRGVVFQVNTYSNNPQQAFLNFRALMTYVENGTGNYSGVNGLADKPEVDFVYDVTPSSTAQYYADLIVDTLTDLGYNL